MTTESARDPQRQATMDLFALLRDFAGHATTVTGVAEPDGYYSINRATIGCRTLWALTNTDDPLTLDVLNAIHAERRRRLSAATREGRRGA